jgi:hypothetical protein
MTAHRLMALVRTDPHLPLALAAVTVLAGEWNELDRRLEGPLLEAVVVAAGLVLAWRRRDRLGLVPLLALCVAFQVVWIAIHVHLGFHGDSPTQVVYASQGQALLDGDYPRSPYPPGAVALFAVYVWLGGGATRTSGAFAMVPFQLLCVIGVWALRTRWSRWLAAFVALWPANLFFWEFRFDLVPTATIVVGVVLAQRGRWHAAGLALGVGALVKWTPGLTAVALGIWLLSSRLHRRAGRLLLAFVIPIALVYIPLLLLRPAEALAPYRAQGVRGITGESLPYLPLRFLGLAEPARHYYGQAHVPSWANTAAIGLQALAVLAVLMLSAVVRRQNAALALAALVPCVFLLTNRIFSPQFFVLILVAVAVAGALVVRTAAEQAVLAATIGAAAVANATLFPGLAGPVAETPGWTYASVAALVLASAATIWLIARASRPAVLTRAAADSGVRARARHPAAPLAR